MELPEARRVPLLGLSVAALETALAAHVDTPYRVRQVWNALHRRGVTSFGEMTDLGKALRETLSEHFEIGLPEIVDRQVSTDGTQKLLFRLADGATVETVDIPTAARRTVCLSSQAGCALACTFCVTGYWGPGRNLTAGEIIGQVLGIDSDFMVPEKGPNIVFMGMGEPLQNLSSVKESIDILAETISWRRITVSTVGLLPGIEELGSWPQRPNLAVSLHAPDDARRSQIMPLNKTYPLPDLMQTLRRYPLEKGRKITFEYILIRDFNDADADARMLARLLRGLRSKVNLIPVNPDPVLADSMVPPSEERATRFAELMKEAGVFTTVRQRRGDDVSGACGQLRAPNREPRGFRRSNLSY